VRVNTTPRPPPLVCAGNFKTNLVYRYGIDLERQGTLQRHEFRDLSPFYAAALSDEYIAISTGGQILVFVGTPECASGHCLFYTEDQNSFVSHLLFSPDGKTLLALANTTESSGTVRRALVAEVAMFPRIPADGTRFVQYKDCFKEVANWGNSVYTPRCLAFSGDSKRIVTSTTNVGDYCEIQILEYYYGRWRKKGSHLISVLNGPRLPKGSLTGIQL